MSILRSFIVFEGLDGAGTTTQIKNLARYYEFNKREYFITNEPTDNPIGKLVRQVLQKKVITTPDALALLYAADRSDRAQGFRFRECCGCHRAQGGFRSPKACSCSSGHRQARSSPLDNTPQETIYSAAVYAVALFFSPGVFCDRVPFACRSCACSRTCHCPLR